MSKFENLCKEYVASRKRYFAYRDECHEIARSVIQGFKDFLSCPDDAIKIHPLDEAEDDVRRVGFGSREEGRA